MHRKTDQQTYTHTRVYRVAPHVKIKDFGIMEIIAFFDDDDSNDFSGHLLLTFKVSNVWQNFTTVGKR